MDNYRYSEESREHDLKIVWKCSRCGIEREDYLGYNEGGNCSCGGEWQECGESYYA